MASTPSTPSTPNLEGLKNLIFHPSQVYIKQDIIDQSKAFELDTTISESYELSIEIDSMFGDLKHQIGGVGIYTHKLYSGKRFLYEETIVNDRGESQTIKHSYPDDNIYLEGEPSLEDYKKGISNIQPSPVGKVYRNLGIVEFFLDLTPLMIGADNIRVTFVPKEPVILNKFKYGNTVAIGNDHRTLFYNDNIIYFTGSEGDFYIPYVNTLSIGDANSDVSGFSKLSDTTIAVFKDNKDDNIYYITAFSTTVGDNTVTSFSVKSGIIGEKAINNKTSFLLANDPLYLTNNGIYSIKVGDNVTTSERYTFERSAFINPMLKKAKDIKNAKAIVHNNRYYLAVDDKVYVADARYKTSPRDQDMSDTFNYEWWVWDNMPVKQWMIVNGELCFLTNNGYVAKFTDDRVDETLNYMSIGDWTGEEATNKIQFNGNNKHLLKDGNKVIVGDKTFYIVTDKDTPYTSQFQLKDENDQIVDVRDEVFGNFMNPFYICDLNNVVSEWYTPVVDMGTSLYSKNLIGSTLTFEPDVEGNVKFGYLTRRSSTPRDKESNLSSSEGVDFDNVDFTDFSFAVNFACSRTLKTRVRNYNYIQFRIVSDNNKDCALNNFVVTYTIGRKNKGVR